MNLPAYQQIPMTKDDKDWMMTIYTKRLSNFLFPGLVHCVIYGVLLFLTMCAFAAVIGFMSSSGNDASFPLRLLHFAWRNKLTLGLLFAGGVCFLAYYLLVLPYKKDALDGIKLKVPFTVERKEYYPVTGQFFIKFEGGAQHHFEVDADTYNSCEEGEVVYREMALHSKHIFIDNDHINVKLFSFPSNSYGGGYYNSGY